MGSKHRVDTKDKKRTRKNAEFGREKRNSGNQELSNEPEKDTIMEGDEAEEDEQNSSSDESSKIIDNEQSDAEEDDDEEEEDDDFPRKKKSKNSKHDDGSTGFSAAVNAILSSHLKAYDRKDPIMARNKKVLKQSESEKLEYKAKKALLAEKKLLGKARKTDIIPIASGEDRSENIRKVLEKETALRKIAQKGAVKLFNAILATQVKTEKEVSENLSGIKNKEEKKELITEVSKEKFLDLVKAAAGSDNE